MSTSALPSFEKSHTPVWLKAGLILLLLATGAEVRAAPVDCEVLAVTDGDTMTVQCGNQAVKNIRLAGVEGPAHQALFWARAQRNLSALLLQKNVAVDVVDTNSEGEQVAQVWLGSTHVNASVVGEGMARCQGPSTQDDWCSRVESSARSNLRGVWSDPWLNTHPSDRPVVASTKRKVSA